MTTVNGIVDIDHVMCQVADTEQAKAAFERLGFHTTPRSSLAGGGVANRLVILTPKGDGVANFTELMAIEDRSCLEPSMAKVLAGAQGIKSLVNTLDDADAPRESQVLAGFAMHDVWPKERARRLPSGEELLVAFRVLSTVPGPSAADVQRSRDGSLHESETELMTAEVLASTYGVPGHDRKALHPPLSCRSTT